MNNNITLCALAPGERAVISGIESQTEERRRFRELGMNDGEPVECVLRRRSISAYLIKGTLIALRAEDAKRVRICARVREESRDKGGCAVWL